MNPKGRPVAGRDILIRSGGSLSRRLHGRIGVPPTLSGGVRFIAGKCADHGSYTYRNHLGHLVEADLADYMERIGFFGAHGSKLIRYVTSQLRPGDWAIDVGANVGLLSSPMAAAVGTAGCVWAIEPLPRNVERLRRLKEANALGQLEILPMALSSTAATARLRLSSLPGGSGSGSFVAPWAQGEFVEVPTARLDALVEERDPGRPLRLIKMDIEGFEAEALKGAQATLTDRQPLVICEFHDALLRAAGSSSEELVGLFADLRYAPLTPPGPLEGQVVDLLLAPSSHRGRH